MFNLIRKKLLAAAQSAMREMTCPNCKHRFKPFADHEARTFTELSTIACPKCGKTFSFSESTDAQKSPQPDPDQPLSQPPGSRIERRPVSATELLFYVPASGRWGFMLFFAIFWNLISWTVFLAFVFGRHKGVVEIAPIFFSSLFPAIGIALAYVAIRGKYATHLLFLGPEFVRLQRALFRRKNYDLPTAEIVHVKKAEFYQQNYQPVYGIEIGAGRRKIRFGSALTELEKDWLCWEIRAFLREQGAPV